MNFNQLIDHTLLKADATKEDVLKLCQEAREYKFKSVCVTPSFIPIVKSELEDSGVEICTVIGFPLGANSTEVKVFETQQAINSGASEIDMVINVSWAKDGHFDLIEREIREIKNVSSKKILKVILETCLLTEVEIVEVCEAARRAGADFVKTSTGFSTKGAQIEDVQLMKKTVGNKLGVKASGGIRNLEDMKKMIAAGATRIGASAGVKIMQELKSI